MSGGVDISCILWFYDMIYALVLESFVYILSLIMYKQRLDLDEHFGDFWRLVVEQNNKETNIIVHVNRHATPVSVDTTAT